MVISKRNAFAAAAHILRAPSMTWLTEQYIDDKNQRIDFEGLLEKNHMLSGGEQPMLQTAWVIWNGGVLEVPTVGSLLRNLDEASWDRVLDALTAFKPTAGMRAAHEVADEAIGLFIKGLERTNMGISYVGQGPSVEQVRAEAVSEVREGFAVQWDELV